MGGTYDLPSALNFVRRLKQYILSKHSREILSDHCNTEKDSDVQLIDFHETSDFKENPSADDEIYKRCIESMANGKSIVEQSIKFSEN